MTYLKVAVAAIKRYRFEQKYRPLINEYIPKKHRGAPFSVRIMKLRQCGVITNSQSKKAQKKYSKLSKILHGIQ